MSACGSLAVHLPVFVVCVSYVYVWVHEHTTFFSPNMSPETISERVIKKKTPNFPVAHAPLRLHAYMRMTWGSLSFNRLLCCLYKEHRIVIVVIVEVKHIVSVPTGSFVFVL